MAQNASQHDPRAHVTKVSGMLDDLVRHLREDLGKFEEPRAQALFETSAEVLKGLQTAFSHYNEGTERGMRR